MSGGTDEWRICMWLWRDYVIGDTYKWWPQKQRREAIGCEHYRPFHSSGSPMGPAASALPQPFPHTSLRGPVPLLALFSLLHLLPELILLELYVLYYLFDANIMIWENKTYIWLSLHLGIPEEGTVSSFFSDHLNQTSDVIPHLCIITSFGFPRVPWLSLIIYSRTMKVFGQRNLCWQLWLMDSMFMPS